jgi:COMPASS component SWD1
MNLELLNPGHQFEVPARLDCELLPPEYQNDNLISPTPTTMSFNRRGHYLAMGYSDGRVLIFDFNTRLGNETEGAGLGVVPALTLNAHEAEVVAVSWTRRARGLLTAGRDGAIRLWDLTVVSDESEVNT